LIRLFPDVSTPLPASPQIRDGDKVVSSLPGHTVFHTSLWATVLERTYGLRVRNWVLPPNGAAVVIPMATTKDGFLRRKGVSVPFSDMCPPLSTEDSALAPAMARLLSWGRELHLGSLEFHGGDLRHLGMQVCAAFVEHVVLLSSDLSSQWARLRTSTQRNVRKAEHAGVRVSFSHRRSAMHLYYRLHCGTRRRHGLPPQPKRFFLHIHEQIVSKGNGFVALAWLGGTLVAGAVFLHVGRRAIYKFGASRREYQELRANNLVMWTAIRWYAERGFKSLSLGRTDTDDSGLLQFKDGWGGERRPLHYWRLTVRGPSRNRPERTTRRLVMWARALMRRLPIPLLRVVGAAAYRYLA
jgi:hypothetical protein